jgi:hypothetical protein
MYTCSNVYGLEACYKCMFLVWTCMGLVSYMGQMFAYFCFLCQLFWRGLHRDAHHACRTLQTYAERGVRVFSCIHVVHSANLGGRW